MYCREGTLVLDALLRIARLLIEIVLFPFVARHTSSKLVVPSWNLEPLVSNFQLRSSKLEPSAFGSTLWCIVPLLSGTVVGSQNVTVYNCPAPSCASRDFSSTSFSFRLLQGTQVRNWWFQLGTTGFLIYSSVYTTPVEWYCCQKSEPGT